MRQALTILFILFALSCLAQRSEWGLVISPAHSQAHMAYGHGVVYGSTPFFAGELIVSEGTVPGFSAEIFREKATRLKHISIKSAFGFLTCGAYQHFDYDYANSIGNIVSVESRFQYTTFNSLAKYSIPIFKKAAIIASLGPHVGYLIESKENIVQYEKGEFVQTKGGSLLSYENRFNYGSQFALGGRYKRMSVEAFYRSYYKFHFNLREGRRVFNYGLALSLYLQLSRTERK